MGSQVRGKVRGRREAGGQCPLLAAEPGVLGNWGPGDWAVAEGGRRDKGSVGTALARWVQEMCPGPQDSLAHTWHDTSVPGSTLPHECTQALRGSSPDVQSGCHGAGGTESGDRATRPGVTFPGQLSKVVRWL